MFAVRKNTLDFDQRSSPFTSENWDSLLLGEVRGGEPLVVRVARRCGKMGEGITALLTPFLIPLPQLSETPKGERLSKLLSPLLNSHKDRELEGGSGGDGDAA